jgi:hypothetical protein
MRRTIDSANDGDTCAPVETWYTGLVIPSGTAGDVGSRSHDNKGSDAKHASATDPTPDIQLHLQAHRRVRIISS